MNHAIFFPLQKFNILTIFMAWINLDLGIQSCFYNGMDAYAMTWLQFAFPLYIWTITIFVITLSRRYHIAARVISRNAVKVLATLLLLSYTKSCIHHNSTCSPSQTSPILTTPRGMCGCMMAMLTTLEGNTFTCLQQLLCFCLL